MEGIGLHFTPLEVIWTLVAALGLWVVWRFYNTARANLKYVIESKQNGARIIIARGGIRKGKIRFIAQSGMLMVGILAGLWETGQTPIWANVLLLVGLILLSTVTSINAHFDLEEDRVLLKYFHEYGGDKPETVIQKQDREVGDTSRELQEEEASE